MAQWQTLSDRINTVAPSATLAVDSKAKAMKAAGLDVVGFGAGEPNFPTPANVVKAAADACLDPKNYKYTPTPGLPELREAIAAKMLRDSGYEVNADQVVVTNGGKQAVYESFQILLNDGDEVIIPAPYWTSYPEAVKLAGGVPVEVFAGADVNFEPSLEALEAARTEHTKAIIVNSPNNPTGAVWKPETVEAIGRWAVEHHIWVISDEIYEHLLYEDAQSAHIVTLVPELADQAVILNGVAKTYAMTGWRIGYLLAPEAVIEQTGKIAELMHSSVNSLAQYAGVAALAGPQDHVAAMREEYRAKRQIVLDGLAGCPVLRLIEPQGAFYAFVDVRLTGLDSGEFADRLLDEEHVAVVPGEAFGEEGRGFVRLSYAGDAGELREGVARLRAFAERVWNPITGHHTATYHPMEVLA